LFETVREKKKGKGKGQSRGEKGDQPRRNREEKNSKREPLGIWKKKKSPRVRKKGGVFLTAREKKKQKKEGKKPAKRVFHRFRRERGRGRHWLPLMARKEKKKRKGGPARNRNTRKEMKVKGGRTF